MVPPNFGGSGHDRRDQALLLWFLGCKPRWVCPYFLWEYCWKHPCGLFFWWPWTTGHGVQVSTISPMTKPMFFRQWFANAEATPDNHLDSSSLIKDSSPNRGLWARQDDLLSYSVCRDDWTWWKCFFFSKSAYKFGISSSISGGTSPNNCQHLEVMPTRDHWHKRLSPPTSCLTSWVELCRFSVEKRIPNSKNICFKVDLDVSIHHLFWTWNELKDGRKSDLNSTKSCRGCVVSSSPRKSTTTMVCAPSSRCSWQPETSNVTCVNLFG